MIGRTTIFQERRIQVDWITGMQKAIDYIEENITEELDYNEIAKRAYSSSFHFQRVFSIMCGFTVGEYICFRRLTLAGGELLATDARVIDIALKYGYDTPDSFTRAFASFHGITPSMSRKQNGMCNLKSFSRLSIKLSFEGGSIMDYRIEEKSLFKLIQKTKMFSSENEKNKVEIPQFWSDCRADDTIKQLCNYAEDSVNFKKAILGICDEFCGNSNSFPYSIGAEYLGGDIPNEFELKEVPAQTWVIFKCVGAMPRAIQNLWHKIYTEFSPSSDYKPVQTLNFEVYPDGDINSNAYESEIWIPVERK